MEHAPRAPQRAVPATAPMADAHAMAPVHAPVHAPPASKQAMMVAMKIAMIMGPPRMGPARLGLLARGAAALAVGGAHRLNKGAQDRQASAPCPVAPLEYRELDRWSAGIVRVAMVLFHTVSGAVLARHILPSLLLVVIVVVVIVVAIVLSALLILSPLEPDLRPLSGCCVARFQEKTMCAAAFALPLSSGRHDPQLCGSGERQGELTTVGADGVVLITRRG
mmetsp:Transcript_111580/g.279424  ORF Transcript_111580/g.279424 Transcript_111580/m.279424 type:complete len:222 (+) Transcript_111580:162-827(+)